MSSMLEQPAHTEGDISACRGHPGEVEDKKKWLSGTRKTKTRVRFQVPKTQVSILSLKLRAWGDGTVGWTRVEPQPRQRTGDRVCQPRAWEEGSASLQANALEEPALPRERESCTPVLVS